MNCANCGKEIYWAYNIEYWCHFEGPTSCGERDGYKLFAEPKIEETIDTATKDVCWHCGVEIHFDEGSQRWGHFFEGEIHKDCLYEYCYADLNPKYKAEPKGDLIIRIWHFSELIHHT